MEKCDYGCGNDFNFILNNEKKCCSPSANKCPNQRIKNSKGQKKLIPDWENGHPEGLMCSYGCGKTAMYLFFNGKLCCSVSVHKCEEKAKFNKGHENAIRLTIINIDDKTILCDYGCNGLAKYTYKNGKNCCSESPNSCMFMKKNNSESKKGISKIWKNGHPKGNLGKVSKLKGKNYEEIHGKEKSLILIDYHQKRFKEFGIKISPENELIRREKIRTKIIDRYSDGWEVKCGRTKKIEYESSIAGKVKLDGTWELAAAKYFDSINVKWIRNKKRFEYFNEIKNTKSTYCPDFYIEDWNTYIEIKGYTTELDLCKWRQFTENIEVWDRKKMKELNLI